MPGDIKLHKKLMHLTIFLISTLLLSACQKKFADYESPNEPYDREVICKRLSDLIKNYAGPYDYKDKNISRRELKRLFNDYQIYGCDK